MKYGIKKRILSLVLCISMILPMVTLPMPVYSVENEETSINTESLKNNVGNQAMFDWWSSFDLAANEESKPGMVTTVDGTDLGVNDYGTIELVFILSDYYYDAESGEHWYKAQARAGETLPDVLDKNPWILYCTDSDVEMGYAPYLALYESDDAIRFVYSETVETTYEEDGETVLEETTNYNSYIIAGPAALSSAVIQITNRDSDYPVSSLAYTEPTNSTTFSKAFDITITKENGEAWTSADGIISLRYEASQFGSDTYTEDIIYGAVFLYSQNSLFSTEVSYRWGYDASDVVYINSGTSTLVFEHMYASFEQVDKIGYFKEDTVKVYNPSLESKDYSVSDLPEYFNIEYSFTLNDTDWYWLSSDYMPDTQYFLVAVADVGQVVNLKNEDTGIIVSGKIPENAELTVSLPEDLSGNIPDFVDTWFTEFYTYSILGYDISIQFTDENGVAQKWQPADDDTVTVTVPGVWDSESFYHRTDVYHVFNEDTQETEFFSTTNGAVNLCDDGSISFETGSFSTFIVASGATTAVSITTSDGDNHTKEHKGHIVYLTKTSKALVSISGVNDLSGYERISDTSNGTIICDGSSANASITATNASVGDSCIFKWSWVSGSTTYTAQVLVVVIDDASNYTDYHDEVIHHIQLNVEQVAVLVNGQVVDTLDDVALGFTDSTVGTLTRVLDPDSAVGYYYTYTYAVPASGTDGTDGYIPSYDTTITLKLDETQTYYDADGNEVDPSTLDYIISDVLLIEGSGSEQDQVTFVGTFPKGIETDTGEIRYLLSIETSYYGENEAFYGDRLSFSTSIGYWDDGNVCPGAGTGSGGGNSSGGIDVAEFSMGYTIGDTTYYVVYSDLTKTIKGDVLGDANLQNATKQFTFSVYRRLLNPAEGTANEWEAFDTFTVTGDFVEDVDGSSISTMTIATVAEKYDPANLDGYQFMLVETGNNIDGYSCNVSYGTANGIFTFDKTESTLAYSVYTYGSGNKTTTLYVYGTNTADTSDDTYKVVTNIVTTDRYSSTTTYESTFDSTKTHQSTTRTTVRSGFNSQTSTSASDWDTHVRDMANTFAKETVGTYNFTGENATTSKENQTSGTIVYSASLSCTNTYEKVKTGLTVNKVVNGAGAPAGEIFTVTVTPTGSTTWDKSAYNYYINDSETPNAVNVVDGVICVTITAGQSLYLDIPVGTYRIQETEGSTIGFTYDTTPYTRTLTSTAGAAVTITNMYSADATLGSLMISKDVVTESDGYSKPTGDSRADFAFTVTIGAVDASYPYIVFESTGSVLSFGTLSLSKGSGTVTMRDGQYVVIDGIKYGTSYSVVEVAATGYTLKESSGTTGAIVAGSTVEASFVNTYKNPLTSLTIKKSGYFDYKDIDPNQSFMFTVVGEADGVDLTVTVHGDGSIIIDGLMVGYEYTVTELIDWSWRYEFATWRFVTDGDTDIEGTTNGATITLGASGNEITFTNTRSEKKWLDGDSWCNNIFKD